MPPTVSVSFVGVGVITDASTGEEATTTKPRQRRGNRWGDPAGLVLEEEGGGLERQVRLGWALCELGVLFPAEVEGP